MDLEQMTANVLSYVPKLIPALIVISIALLIDERVQGMVERTVARRDGQRELARLIGRMARAAVLGIAALMVVAIFGWYPILTSFIASLGIVGLIVAFALQDITKNFASGVLLLLLRPFRLGDRIKVRDFEGLVIDISLRATTIRTADGVEVLVPNADVYSSPIINYSRYPRRRHHIPLTIPAAVSVTAVQQRLEDELRRIPELEDELAPQVIVTAISGDSLTLDASYWLDAAHPSGAEIMSRAMTRLHQVVGELKAEAAASQVDS